MPKEFLPPRRPLLALTLVVAVSVLAGAALPFIVSSPAHAPATASGTHVSVSTAAGTLSSVEANVLGRSVTGHAGPDGGGGFDFGVIATVALPAGSRPAGVAVDTANDNVYVADSHSGDVYVINGSTQQLIPADTVHVGTNETSPAGLVYDSVTSEVYVADFGLDGGGNVKVISPVNNTAWSTVSVPGGPVGLATDSLGNVYVTQQDANSLSEITGTKVVQTIGVGGLPIAVAFDPASGDLYVANAGSANVTLVDTTTFTTTASVPVGSYPLGVAYDSGNHDMYVSNWKSNNTTVISGTSVVTSLAVGPGPVGVAYDSLRSVVSVVAEFAGAVDFISNTTNTVIGNVSVGDHPGEIAYDSVNTYQYVSNANSSNVSVISTSPMPPYAVTFTETGLSVGTDWSATLAGVTSHSTTDSIVFSETNGTYPYSVGAIAGYTVSPLTGSVTVKGFPVPVAVTFSPVVYPVTFYESGLPSGTLWSIIFNGTPNATKGASLTFTAKNGSYPFAGAAVGYTAGPASGNVVVNGAAVSQTITFAPLGTSTFTVTFTETGLPSGTTWAVTLNGTPTSSTGSSLNFSEPNGKYTFSVGTVSGYNETPSSGNVTVSGGPVGVSVTFSTGPVPSSTSPAGTPLWVYLLVAIIVAVVVIGVVAFLRRPPPSRSSPASTPPAAPPTSP